MNKHRGLSVGLCVSLFFLNLSSVSSAAPQIVGTKCAKAGSFRTAKNVKYQCKKSTNGLRWVTVSAGKKTIPVTPATPSTTTTIPIPKDAIAKKIYDLVVAAIGSATVSNSSIEYISEATGNENLESEAKQSALKAASLYAKLGMPLPPKTIVFFSQTDEGLRRLAVARGCEQLAIKNESLAGGGYAIGGTCNSGEPVVIAGRIQNWSRDQGATIGFHHVLPHELFHQWQMTNASFCVWWKCGNSDFPKWLYEGTPQVMARLVYWSWNQSKTPDEWLNYWYTAERPDMFSMCKSVQIESMIDPSGSFNPTGCAYSKGQIAVEVLIANYGGFESLIKLHTTKTTPGYKDFPNFFKSVTGREITEFYSEVNNYFVTRNWP